MNTDHYKPTKQQRTIRLDSDVLEWLKKDGKGYQTKANDLPRNLILSELAR
ncbi:BrnA antitoxin family protein [Faucicola mancuniensis]|uniref:BrnA antitoxin family protein n=1 Tax=Faucicola mancuniensis TaxID=1309795 RepID=UPI0028E81362|nr:BrnA antitoxin family protein [uncultured Moraxella sp.]